MQYLDGEMTGPRWTSIPDLRSTGRQRVLVVADEPDLATTCVRFLQLVGYAPRSIADAREALGLIGPDRPDLVLVDLRRPGDMDGIEFVKAVHRERPSAPIILCSALASDGERRRALAAGAAALLSTPFSLAELRLAIERVLGPVPARSSPEGTH